MEVENQYLSDMTTISYSDFEKLDIRVGKIVEVADFERARVPAYKLKIDLGPELGIKQTSARFKTDYTPEQLLGRQCLCVVNFEPKNIGGFMSEVLMLGVPRDASGSGSIVLVTTESESLLGGRMY
jgi:tRNA-binding protein